MSASKPQESEVRIKHSLNKKEEDFIVNRRRSVYPSLENVVETHCIQVNEKNIALLGSGGGQRAMVGLLGSLVQLDKAGLLKYILYLSGVSGSTWCMASLYQEKDWSTKLESVKDNIIERLSGPAVSWGDAFAKLEKYYSEKDLFSLTDIWAAMVVTTYVKEINENTLTKQWSQQSKDPFPIYTVIDKQCKQQGNGDPWFEITPHEAGYSLTGAFVRTSSFSSQFDDGSKKKDQPEMDMLYLQGLCGSALADGEEILKCIWQNIKDIFKYAFPNIKTTLEEMGKDPVKTSTDQVCQVLMDLVDMNLSVLSGKDPSALDKYIRDTLNELTKGTHQLIFQETITNLTDKEEAKQNMQQYTMDVCHFLGDFCNFSNVLQLGFYLRLCICVAQWKWGRKYNFLYNMKDANVPSTLWKSETRDYIDAGLLLNSPFFSVLREERNIDLIISLDFSEGDPFMTLTQASETCKKHQITFPDLPKFTDEDKKKPKDFYVFEKPNAPTVIHIPLFNVVNCGDDIETWRNKYSTFQGPYSAEMITNLMEVAGKNISNNKDNLLEKIQKTCSPGTNSSKHT